MGNVSEPELRVFDLGEYSNLISEVTTPDMIPELIVQMNTSLDNIFGSDITQKIETYRAGSTLRKHKRLFKKPTRMFSRKIKRKRCSSRKNRNKSRKY